MVNICIRVAHAGNEVLKRRFQHSNRAGNRFFRFFRRRSRNAHFRLDDVNSIYNVGVAGNIVLDARNLFRVIKQPLHFLFCAAVAQLQVIKHCERLL